MSLEPLQINERKLEHWISCFKTYNVKKMSVIDMAKFYASIYELCQSEGKDQTYAAQRLGISQGTLTKHLKFYASPALIKNLSIENGIVDIEALYILASLSEKFPEPVAKFIHQWKNGSISGGIRSAVKRLANSINSKNEDVLKPSSANETMLDISIIRTRKGYSLILKNSTKQLSFDIDNDFFNA